jgi:hypothetical protein
VARAEPLEAAGFVIVERASGDGPQETGAALTNLNVRAEVGTCPATGAEASSGHPLQRISHCAETLSRLQRPEQFDES